MKKAQNWKPKLWKHVVDTLQAYKGVYDKEDIHETLVKELGEFAFPRGEEWKEKIREHIKDVQDETEEEYNRKKIIPHDYSHCDYLRNFTQTAQKKAY